MIVEDTQGNTDERSFHVNVHMPDFEFEMFKDIPEGKTYDSLDASSSPLDLSKKYYEVRYSSHDGFELGRHSFVEGSDNNGTIVDEMYNENNNTWKDDGTLNYTSSDNKVFNIIDENFEVKYLGTISIDEANQIVSNEINDTANVFQNGDLIHGLAVKTTQDRYKFHDNYQTKHDDGNEEQFSSLDEFVNYFKVSNDNHNWFGCDGDCHDGGITFSADSNLSAGHGKLVKVDSDSIVDDNAGTWEIKDVDGQTILATSITNWKYDDYPIFKYDGTGVLSGNFSPAGDKGIFFWFNESGRDHLKTFIQNYVDNSLGAN